MALQSQAQLLDELMGKNRNNAPGARINTIRFDDDDVCKYSLIGFCPHDLFVNTRADLGPCNKIHDEELKKQYEKSSRYSRLGYEEDYERFLRSLLMDVERKIKRGIERLKLTQSDQANQKTPLQVKQERVAFLKEKINELIKEAETLGEEGRIEEAQSTLESCEKYKTECKYLENQLELAQHNAEQKQMEVCDVCGSFLIVNDAQSRVEEHISGKQHMGYAKLRSALEEIRKKRQDEYEKREKERTSRQPNSDRDRRDRDRDRDRERDRDRDRERDRERDRDRDRDRERDRDRNSKSSSSSSARRNGSSRDVTSSDRDRDRDREKDRKSGSESRSKRRTRSRSKSKDDRKHLKTSDSHDDDENRKKNSRIEKEADEFLKLVDNLGSKKDESKTNGSKRQEEKEEGEDTDMDEGEIRGNQ